MSNSLIKNWRKWDKIDKTWSKAAIYVFTEALNVEISRGVKSSINFASNWILLSKLKASMFAMNEKSPGLDCKNNNEKVYNLAWMQIFQIIWIMQDVHKLDEMLWSTKYIRKKQQFLFVKAKAAFYRLCDTYKINVQYW